MYNSSSWLVIMLASIIFAYMIAKLIEIWFSKDSLEGEGYKYNQKLFWTSFVGIFLVALFFVPCYFDQLLCINKTKFM